MSVDSRKALIAKIKALLAKTVGNGCTEAEAMSALAKAREMIAAHAVDETDVAFGGEDCADETRVVSDRDKIRERLCTAVGKFCDCASWKGPGFDAINFCGLESDVGFAHWLLDMLADFVARELALYLERTWKPGAPRVRRVESAGFVAGCTSRISERLLDLVFKPVSGNGRDLVVAKNALIERHMNAIGVKLRNSGRYRLVDGKSHEAGEAAGDGAHFSRPIDSGGPQLRLVHSKARS